MRKVAIQLKVRLLLELADDLSIKEVVNDLDYGFTSDTPGAMVKEEEILYHEVNSDTKI